MLNKKSRDEYLIVSLLFSSFDAVNVYIHTRESLDDAQSVGWLIAAATTANGNQQQ
jgi:hypothetical protein